MKIKTLAVATLAGLVAVSFNCVADPIFKLVDETTTTTTTTQNSATDATTAATSDKAESANEQTATENK